MTDRYILDGKTPVEEPDLIKWGKWFEEHDNRRVAVTYIPESIILGWISGLLALLGRLCRRPRKQRDCEIMISTVFLGIDHRFGDEGEPILFETMIFGGEHDEYQIRCSTWEQAEANHEIAVRKVRGR